MPDSVSQSCTSIDDAINNMRSLITIDHLDKESLKSCSQFIGSSSLYCLRFASLDTANLKSHSYVRIKHNPISFTSSNEFEHIIVLPNTEENMNFVILIPRQGSLVSNSLVRDTLQQIQVKEQDTKKSLWLPQFSIAATKSSANEALRLTDYNVYLSQLHQ